MTHFVIQNTFIPVANFQTFSFRLSIVLFQTNIVLFRVYKLNIGYIILNIRNVHNISDT